MASKLYVLEDNLVEVNRLRDMSTGEYVNNALILGTLYADDGNGLPDMASPIAGAIDFPLSYVAGSDGLYQGNLNETLEVVVGALYHLNIIGTADLRDMNRWIRLVAARHKASV